MDYLRRPLSIITDSKFIRVPEKSLPTLFFEWPLASYYSNEIPLITRGKAALDRAATKFKSESKTRAIAFHPAFDFKFIAALDNSIVTPPSN